MNTLRKSFLFSLITLSLSTATAQTTAENWSWHFQFTSIMQGHGAFESPYAGQNSLNDTAEHALSVTSTFYFGRKLWKGASVYVNPEIAGGKGISSALGIAGFTNGECFRIGDPSPAVYMARAFLRQQIHFGNSGYDTTEAGSNQLGGELIPQKGLTITLGKFSIADVYDANSYSHDPRTQFLNWSLMSCGAWDYPANTRGYTWGGIVEAHMPGWVARASLTMVPTTANGSTMDENIGKARGETLELEKNWGEENHRGAVRVIGFRNFSRARSYRDALLQFQLGNDTSLDVNHQSTYGGKKYGFAINIEQELGEHLGAFARAGWNDGQTATWVFTEIDQSAQIGGQIDGSFWKREKDVFGIAASVNGISEDHRDFLAAGGYGFIIGDGKLPNYAMETIAEAYYSAQIAKAFWLTADYQFIAHPAYNADRGPVHVWAVRAHVAF